MRRRLSRAAKKKPHPKTKLGLPDLDQARAAVLGSLHSPEFRRGYQHSINEFINWYCSEPRLSFNKTVVIRYRIHLESRSLAPGTINVRLAAIRRLAYEAADSGLLSPELAAGIRRVKRARRLVRALGAPLREPVRSGESAAFCNPEACRQLPALRFPIRNARCFAVLAVPNFQPNSEP